MFTTVNNSAMTMASSLSTIVLSWFDVSKSALVVASDVCENCVAGLENSTCVLNPDWKVEGGDFEEEDLCGTHPGGLSNMKKLTLVTTAFQMSGILFVGLLPKTRDDLMNLNYGSGSRIGGAIFIFITIGSILNSVIVGVLNVVSPGWSGES